MMGVLNFMWNACNTGLIFGVMASHQGITTAIAWAYLKGLFGL